MFLAWVTLVTAVVLYAWVRNDWSEFFAKVYWSGMGILTVYLAGLWGRS
jgi:hypothetical protein